MLMGLPVHGIRIKQLLQRRCPQLHALKAFLFPHFPTWSSESQMDLATSAVIVAAAFCGSFCRAATGFGGSIIFELIYNLCGQFHVAKGLSNALRMVELGMVLEMATSPVMFLSVARKIPQFRRSLFLLSMLCLPGTMLGSYCLLQAQEHAAMLAALKTGLNLLFLSISIFKLSEEVPQNSSTQGHGDSLALLEKEKVDDDDERICREMGLGLVLVGFADSFLNGLIGLPGPPSMIYFASVLKSDRMTPDTCMVLTQTFFLLTTFMRGAALGSPAMWHEWLRSEKLVILIPLPALLALKVGWEARKYLDHTILLRMILILLLLSSLMGMGIFQGSLVGLTALAITGVWLLVMAFRVMPLTNREIEIRQPLNGVEQMWRKAKKNQKSAPRVPRRLK